MGHIALQRDNGISGYEPSRRSASARRERALAVAAERGGGRRAHGAGEPSRPPASARCGRALTAAPRPAPRPRRQAPRQPRPSTAAARPDAATPAPASRAAPRPRRPDAGLPERHDRRARSPRAAVARARGCWSAMAGGRRGARPRRCSAAGLLSAPDSNEENERIRTKRKGHFSHFAYDFMCFVFLNRLISL